MDSLRRVEAVTARQEVADFTAHQMQGVPAPHPRRLHVGRGSQEPPCGHLQPRLQLRDARLILRRHLGQVGLLHLGGLQGLGEGVPPVPPPVHRFGRFVPRSDEVSRRHRLRAGRQRMPGASACQDARVQGITAGQANASRPRIRAGPGDVTRLAHARSPSAPRWSSASRRNCNRASRAVFSASNSATRARSASKAAARASSVRSGFAVSLTRSLIIPLQGRRLGRAEIARNMLLGWLLPECY